MPAGTKNLLIEQGAKFNYGFVKCNYDPANPPNYIGTPVDLTNYTARAQIRKNHKATEFYVELTTENNGITLGGVLGTIELYMGAEDTAALNFTEGVWDLEIINKSDPDDVERLLQGTVTLPKEVTRPVI